MDATAALNPTHPHKSNLQPVWAALGKAGRTAKRALDGAALGIAVGGLAGAILGMLFFAWTLNTPFGKFFDEAVSALIILVVVSTLGGLSVLAFAMLRYGLRWLYDRPLLPLRWISAAPCFLTWLIPLPLVFIGAGIYLASQLYAWFPLLITYFLTLQGPVIPIVLFEAVLGLLTGLVLTFRQRRLVRLLAFAPAAALNLFMAVYFMWPGTDDYLVKQPISPAVAFRTLSGQNLGNPGATGPFTVQACTYGSGSDLRRPEYAQQACWTTPTVNASLSLIGNYQPPSMEYFTWFWGFDFSKLPLNGRVWAPVADRPMPLVLIVHGNHMMGDFSDAGYAYLGEHLASQGFIVVSIDENFLNGFFMDDMGKTEIPVRAWMMLKHLQQWRTWNEDPQHPFYHKVDLDQIAVMGHSRGGESAVMAAVLNRLEKNPLNLVDDFDFGFNIRAVVEIAPSEGSNKINYQDLQLEDTSYLLLQGGHDADAYMVNGIRQYARVDVSGNVFKTAVYAYRANHGQFNSDWARGDKVPNWMLNLAPLLSASEQEQEAKVFITAFLKAALLGEDTYRQLFQRPWAGADWLPQDIVLSRYQDARVTLLHDFEGPAKSFTNIKGVTLEETGFTNASLESLKTREPDISQNNTVLRLAWDHPGATYTLNLPQGLSQGSTGVTFALAPADEQQPPADLAVELVDAAGRVAKLALGDAAALPVLLPAQLVKNKAAADLMGMNFPFERTAERFLQTEVLSFDQFEAEPGFEPEQLAALRFVFDRSTAGAVLLDEVGLVQ